MAITGETVLRYMKHGLDEADMSASLSMLATANQAGQFLADAYDWRWKIRPPATLTAVDGQNYILFPSDFSGLLCPPQGIPGGVSYMLGLTTMEEIARFRKGTMPGAPTAGFYAAVAYQARSGTTPPLPRLELWPTPDSTTAGAIAHLYYRASWEPLTSAGQTVALPPYMEALYLMVARAFAQGLEDEDAGHLEDRLQKLMTGALWIACTTRDAGEQSDYGIMADGPAAYTGELLDPSTWNLVVNLPGA